MASSEFILDELTKLLLPNQSVHEVIQALLTDLWDRLHNSDISMLSNGILRSDFYTDFLQSKPSKQQILAIDIGGTKLKYGIISMPDCSILFQDGFDLEAGLVNLQFFDVIVEQIVSRLHGFFEGKISNGTFFVSITFSFPLSSENEIITMGKGFNMTDEVKGIDILDILKNSFMRALKKSNNPLFSIKMGRIINDSVAVHLTNKVLHGKNGIALVLGTGINACFELPLPYLPEKKRPTGYENDTSLKMIINAEAGFLGEKIITLTQFDTKKGSDDSMPLEYVTSGKWLPLTLQRILKSYRVSDLQLDFIDGRLLVDIVEGRTKLEQFQIQEPTLMLIRNIGKLLLQRGAYYLVVTLTAISRLIKLNPSDIVEVGYVGSFLANSQYYREQVNYFSDDLIKLTFLDNSNLIGSAIATYLNA